MTLVTLTLSLLAAGGVERSGAEGFAQGLTAVIEHQTEATPGWPWERGDARALPNLGGVVALTLLHTYAESPSPATWVTLVQYAHALRDFYAPADRLPYRADIEFLARLGAAGVDPSAPALAKALFARLRQTSPTGADEYQRLARGRASTPEIIGYDAALGVRAALAVGERAWAESLADATIASGHLRVGEGQDSFQITSAGALLHALSLLERPADRALLERAATALAALRSGEGSWAFNNTQATAYAVLGLSAMRHLPVAALAATAGKEWLLRRQLQSGAWAAYHDGMPEPFVGPVIPLAEAEALAALLTAP